MTANILIVDDEADIRSLLQGILEDEGYQTRCAGNSAQALAMIAQQKPDLVIQDIWLQNSELDGIEILKIVKDKYPDIHVIMISGHGTIETAVSSIKVGAYDFIEKPFKTDRLLHLVSRALEASALKQENTQLKQKTEGPSELLGRSQIMGMIRQAIGRVAPTGSRVLITGAPGTGKDIVAKLIHKQSRRADGPYVSVNCATMHPERMEVELFGREDAGGAHKPGFLEMAHGGTLLLDEVADMPIETQGKIVRVLQEQSFERVGGQETVEVDVRILASSNRDLKEEMAAGNFRQDLFYRLNVVPLPMPSLAERVEDIQELAEYFMDAAAMEAGMAPRKIANDALAAMQSYNWPGNVRQLKNIMEWLLIMSGGDADQPIRLKDLPPEIGGEAPTSLKVDQGTDLLSLPLREAREVFEREYLMSQVNRYGGNISKTSEHIGMERSALHRKLKSLGIHGQKKSNGNDRPSKISA